MHKKKLLLIIVGLLLVVVCVLLLVSKCGGPKEGTLQYEAAQVAGLLDTGRSAEEIQDTLNTIVDEGRFSVSCNSAMNVKNGELDVRIENIPGNQYLMQVDVIIQGGDYDGTLIYSSKLIRPGFSVESGSIAEGVELPTGFYDALAVFSAIDEETQESVGKTQAYVIVSVPWGE